MKATKILSIAVLALLVTSAYAAPARADWDDHHGYEHHEWREHEHWRERHAYYPTVVAPYWVQPAPRVVYVQQPVYVAPYPSGLNILFDLR